jgi:hypothetical protein
MSDDPLKPEASAVDGWRIPAHGGGRLRPFKPGQSGNPGGIGGRYQQVVRMCREAGPAVAQRLIEIALDPNEERRIVVVAGQEVLNRGFGRVREMRDGDLRGPAMNLEAVSEAKLELVIRALEAARDAKRAQAQGGEVDEPPDAR